MKTRSLSLIVSLILLLMLGGLFLIPQINTSRQPERSNDPIPYIYYYSDLEHAFIIERADGTDSRLLAQGVMPEDHNVIDSVQWSPSGKYLAWRSHRYNGPGAYYVSGWLVSADGNYISDLLPDAVDVFLMEWSPNQDWLVVGFSGTIWDSYEIIRIIDVPNNRIVSEVRSNGVEYMDPPYYREMPDAWAEDGSAIYFTYNHFSGTSITKLGLDGLTQQWYFDTNEPLASFNRERLMSYEYVHRDGSYQTDWIISDLTTGETRTYEQVENSYLPEIDYDVLWNPDRTYALVTEKPCEDDSYGYRRCSPNAVSLFNWETGIKYDLPDNLRVPRHEYDIGDASWSLDGQVAVLQDAEGRLHVLNSETQEIFALGVYHNWRWHQGNDLLLFEHHDNERSVLYFDWQTQTSSNIAYLEMLEPYSLSFSPDFSFVGYDGADVRVHNLISGEVHNYPRHSRTSYGGPVIGYKWHESNDWFFAGSNTQIIDSCCNSRAITIHYINQSVGRELTLCYGVHTCAGFVPDGALAHLSSGQSTSLISEPLQILLHENAVEGVIWNSDGTQLVTYSRQQDWEDGSVISVWDMTTNEPTLMNEISTNLLCESHNSACPLRWESDYVVGIPLFTYDGSSKDYYFQLFDIVTGEIETTILVYEDRASTFQISEYYIPYVPYEDNPEQPAYVVHRESETRISDFPLTNLSAWGEMPVSYDEATGLVIYSTVYDRGGVWDSQTGEQIDIMNWTGHAAVLHPDGTQLAVASSRFVSIWDMTPYIEQASGE